MPLMKIGKFNIEFLLFTAAFLMSIVMPLMPTLIPNGSAITILAILGAIAGIIAISVKERITLLLSATAIAVVGAGFGFGIPFIDAFVKGFLLNIATFAGAMAIVVALISVAQLHK